MQWNRVQRKMYTYILSASALAGHVPFSITRDVRARCYTCRLLRIEKFVVVGLSLSLWSSLVEFLFSFFFPLCCCCCFFYRPAVICVYTLEGVLPAHLDDATQDVRIPSRPLLSSPSFPARMDAIFNDGVRSYNYAGKAKAPSCEPTAQGLAVFHRAYQTCSL